MGSGKTSVGKVLEERLERKMLDMDELIVEGEGMSINEIFSQFGEEKFRELETKYLEKMLNKKNKIIATGGGVILKEENVSILKRIGTVVFLQSDKEQLAENLRNDTTRPLLKEGELESSIAKMLNIREPMYFEASNIIIQTKEKDIEDIAEEIIALM